jgi:hypothetical protein
MAPLTDKERHAPGQAPAALADPPAPEQRAYAALDDLSRRYRGRALAADEVGLFVERIDRALGSCLRSFVALRRGQQQLRSALGLGEPHQDATAVADDPQAIASGLLGAESDQVQQQLQDECKGVLIQQMGVVSGLMAGLNDLLAELAPEAVAQQTDTPDRPAALWDAYRRLHQRLACDGKQTFVRVFGPHFARAVSAMFGDTN